MNIKGSPFVFSDYMNTFVSFGCNNWATVAETDHMVDGCKSHCNPSFIYQEQSLPGFKYLLQISEIKMIIQVWDPVSLLSQQKKNSFWIQKISIPLLWRECNSISFLWCWSGGYITRPTILVRCLSPSTIEKIFIVKFTPTIIDSLTPYLKMSLKRNQNF